MTEMTDHRIEAGLKKGIGQLQDAVGDFTRGAGAQVRGKLDAATGSAKDAVGQGGDMARDLWEQAETYTRKSPRTALAITLGVGVLVGLTLLGGKTLNPHR